jgi:hypothetical protein
MHVGDDDSDPTFYPQPNNITEINNNDGGQHTTHYKYIYQYNSSNYPTAVSLQNVAGGGLYKGINKMVISTLING